MERKLAMVGDGYLRCPGARQGNGGICCTESGRHNGDRRFRYHLLHDNISLLDWLVSKAKQTQTVVKQNLILAIIAIVCASLPALGGIVPLWLAVILHEGGTVLVGLNALRLLRN